VHVCNFWPSQRSWCIINCLAEGWRWHPETSEIATLCSKQAQRHLCSVLSCSKNSSVPTARQCMFANYV